MTKGLKYGGFVVIALFALYSCTCGKSQKPTLLPQGKYLACPISHSDTLLFKSIENKTDSWSWLTWTVHQDSISQDDANGKRWSFCEARSTYRIKNDTLTLYFKAKDQGNLSCTNRDNHRQQYKIVRIYSTSFVLIEIHEPLKPTKNGNLGRGPQTFGDERITRDIQLR